ncbi:hypothetical protein H4Q26_016624 [Puccinia striiformis f. sp. tritici PST-130]|nr:hypothetical protein H4Q26_016624 [Puccinia striiformis f. sp. tritici PST-130]
MADSTPEPLAELEYVRLGDLAARGFKRLSERYREPTGQDGDATLSESQTLSIDETIASKEKRLNDLQFHLLPALHLQFADLSNLLRPSCLQVGDLLKFKRILGIQDDIERTIDEIQSHINILCAQGSVYTTANRADDQHLKQLKSVRLHSIRAQFLAAFPFIFLIFCDAFRLLIDLTINPEPFKTSPHFPGDYLIEETFYYIDWTIECIKGSELDLAQCFWRLDLKTSIICSWTLGFINTLDEQERLPYSTEMSSEQIESLAQSIRDVTGDLGDLIALFRIADQEMIDDRAELSQGFLNIGTWLKSRFDPPLLAILLYLLPIIPRPIWGFPIKTTIKIVLRWPTQKAQRKTRSTTGSQAQMSDADSEGSDELEYLRMGALAAQGFRRLSEKYREPTDQNRNAILSELDALSIDEATTTSKERLLNDLQYHLLPALRLHLANISRLLTPSYLCVGFESKIKRVLAIQLEIERTIDPIKSHINLLCPERSISATANRADDQHLKQFKSYRLRSLRAQFAEASTFIFRTFVEAFKILEDLIIRSELDIVQCFWRLELKNFGLMLLDIRVLHYGFENEEEPTDQIWARESLIELADMAISLIKISNLFFTKLSTRGMNRKRLSHSTEMSSQQIESLAQSIGKVTSDLGDLIALLRTADEEMVDNRAEVSQRLVSIVLNLKSRFDPPLLLVLLYLLPIVPDTDPSYYKSWFVTWNTQRILVTENFINLAKSLANSP